MGSYAFFRPAIPPSQGSPERHGHMAIVWPSDMMIFKVLSEVGQKARFQYNLADIKPR